MTDLAPAYEPHSRRRRLLHVGALAGVGAVLMFSACGSPTQTSGDASPISTPTASAAPVRAEANCSERAVLSALPDGATMEEFACAKAGDTEWAAARVAPGSTVFFLKWNGTRWLAEESDSICGTASAGLPPSLLSYCGAAAPASPRPTATRTSSPPTPIPTPTSLCTATAILAALPGGATLQKFSCADVAGEEWAAARVDPGATVFFLQRSGDRWRAEDSDSVCGTASAGLPPSLLSYCRT